MEKALALSLFIIILLIPAAHCSAFFSSEMLIRTTVSGKERTIYQSGNTTEAFVPDRDDLGTCRPVRRLTLSESVSHFNFSIENGRSPVGRIAKNSNPDVASPVLNLSVSLTSDTIVGTIEFNCDKQKAKASRSPWSFVTVEIDDQGNPARFEVLKVCDSSVYGEFDWGQVLLFVIVILAVAWAGRAKVRITSVVADQVREDVDIPEEPRADLTCCQVVIFVGVASLVLVLAFFFTETLLKVFTVGMCVSGMTLFGMYMFQTLQLAFSGCPQIRSGFILRRVLRGSITLGEIVCHAAAVALMLGWLITRNWVLNNIIGVFFVFCFLRAIKISSLIVSTIMLGLLFLYDIFWVFYSDRVFGGNVMVTVATQFDLPIKLLMPHLAPLPTSQCMLIGLGDLVIPGLVIAYAYRLGERLQTYAYYATSLAAYILAIVLCDIMLVVYEQAQPALLYISPSLLIFISITALARKEIRKVWSGSALGTGQPTSAGKAEKILAGTEEESGKKQE